MMEFRFIPIGNTGVFNFLGHLVEQSEQAVACQGCCFWYYGRCQVSNIVARPTCYGGKIWTEIDKMKV